MGFLNNSVATIMPAILKAVGTTVGQQQVKETTPDRQMASGQGRQANNADAANGPRASNAGDGGGTMLSGAQGVDPRDQALGKKSLLGT